MPNTPTTAEQFHVIVGAGATGSATANLLAGLGARVRMITRSGSGPDHPSIERVASDASDADALRRLSADADVIYNCANPPYHRWVTEWPPLAESILAAATANDAVLVTISNLYGYAPPTAPMRTSDPLDPSSVKGRVRVEMWERAKAAHDAGQIRIVEARASDFIGQGLGEAAHMGDRVTGSVAKGKGVYLLGDVDVEHSWTAIDDVARTLVTLGADERAWGSAWHVPTVASLTQRQLVHRMCAAAGREPVAVRALPSLAVRLAGVFMPVMAELRELEYQFTAPFIMDSTDTSDVFGLQPTPLDETLSFLS